MTAQERESLVELLTARPRPENATPAEMREQFDKLADFLAGPEPVPQERLDAGGVPAAMITAAGAAEDACILYFHGGGYVIGNIETHQVLAHDLSREAGMPVLSLDYRLAPEHPFPAPVEDAVAAYRWLLDRGLSPARLALAGDSAGGGLVAAALVALKDAGLPLPAAGVCFSPWTDMEATGDSMASRAEADPMVQKDRLLQMAGLYLGGADARHPHASPLHADLSGLPPLLIQVGDAEILLDDATRLAERARAAGVEVELDVWDEMFHVWQLFAPKLSEGRDALAAAGGFIARKLG